MKTIWITWEPHRRTREIARALDIELFEFAAPGGWGRYPRLLAQTTRCLLRRRPACLFIQCPSVVLAAWVGLLKPLFRYALVADLHNEAVQPFINRSDRYRRLLRFIHRAADLNVVTNDRLLATVEANGGRALVLPDRVPSVGPPNVPRTSRDENLVVFVCTFAPDEPYHAVITAGAILSTTARIRITGNPRGLAASLALPANVTLTGFLPTAEYEQLLEAAHVVVDLTTMEDCLVCGAYEAVAFAKPLVTSDTAALRAAFPRGAVFTAHDPVSIADAIALALERRPALVLEMRSLAPQLEAEWQSRREALLAALATLVPQRPLSMKRPRTDPRSGSITETVRGRR